MNPLEPLLSVLFSSLGKLSNQAIYFACINYFFNLSQNISGFILFPYFTLSQSISRSSEPIRTIFFHQVEGICLTFIDPDLFFRLLKGSCHGN